VSSITTRSFKRILLVILVLLAGGAGLGWVVLARVQAPDFWEPAIARYEEADRERPPEWGAIVFTGSSSIRMWKSLAQDMQPLRVLNRGFGGSHIAHVNHFASRIVLPYHPSAVVLYAGDNDLSAGSDKTPASVLADFERFVTIVHGGAPRARIYFIAIKPSRQRWDRWPVMREANALIAAFALERANVEFVDIAAPMLGDAGPPAAKLFLADGLHLSAEGYALWTAALKPLLLAGRSAS
jgi:lysophospholipase L1-like esterase